MRQRCSICDCVYQSYVPEAKEQMLDNASQAMAKKKKHTLVPSGRVYMKGKDITRTGSANGFAYNSDTHQRRPCVRSDPSALLCLYVSVNNATKTQACVAY